MVGLENGVEVPRVRIPKILLGWHHVGRRTGAIILSKLQIKTGGATGPEELKKVLATIPEVRRAAWITGNYDFTLEVAFRDQDDLVRVIELLRNKCGIQESYTRLICRELFAAP